MEAWTLDTDRRTSKSGSGPSDRGSGTARSSSVADLSEIKGRIHRKLIDRLNLANLDMVGRDDASRTIREVIQEIMGWENVALNVTERESLAEEILDEIFGLGPLEPLMKDPQVSDILVNTHKDVFVERNGRLYRTDVRFQNDRHLLQVIDRIVSAIGRRIDDSSPMVDARLPDNSRVNAVIPPLAVDGPHLSIRRFKRDVLSDDDLVAHGTVNESMLRLLRGVVKARLNVLIAGGTGAGKTTLLNVLSSHIPTDERIITIEDSAELQLQQPHVVRLETRPANVEGRGEITQRSLVINALRMRPDRILLGEVRGSEAIDMLQAMNTGHDGSLTTLHANSPRDALSRLETMVAMANLNLPERGIRQQIASAIQVVVQVGRLPDGSRKVLSISEIVGMEGDVVTMQELFVFEREGLDEEGNVVGRFRPTGIRPRFSDALRVRGIDLPASMFIETVGSSAPTADAREW